MARTTSNIDLVPREVLEQLKQLDTQLGQTTGNLKALLVPVQQVSDALAKSTINYKDLIDTINMLKTVEGQATETTKRRRTIVGQIADYQKKLANATSKEAQELAKLRVQYQQVSQANKLAAKETLAHANSIEAMRVKLSQMKAEWATMDTGTDAFKKMTEDINKLNAEILKNEQAIGVHNRNVGNYASGFNMLQYNIQQVARELPSLTISASQFFLAISNNLPMLVDELQRARAANAALRKEGQATVPVWKQVLKGIVSWQTALVVAITRSVSFSFLRIFAISGTLSPIDWRALAFQQWLLNGSHRKVARSGGQSDGTRRVHGSQLAGEQAAQPGSELFDINQRAKIVYDVNPELPAASTFTFKI